MITRKVFIVLFAVFFLAGSALAAEVEGVKLPDTAKAGDQELILNGAGQKLSSGIGVYVGALYLKQKSGDATAILAADEPMNVKMVITSFMVNSDNMKSGFRDAFKECATTDLTPLKTKIDAFVGTFKEVNDRDVFDLAYVPGKGVEVSPEWQSFRRDRRHGFQKSPLRNMGRRQADSERPQSQDAREIATRRYESQGMAP